MNFLLILFPLLLIAQLQATQFPKGIDYSGMAQQQIAAIPIIKPELATFPLPNQSEALFFINIINKISDDSVKELIDASITFCKKNNLEIDESYFSELQGKLRALKIQEDDNSEEKAYLELLKIVNTNDIILKHYFGDKAEIVKKLAIKNIDETAQLQNIVEKQGKQSTEKLLTFADYALKRFEQEGLVKKINKPI
ncbi:MAG: hypothetical protein BWY54_00727 [Candidatus Dependentiae bacterium ADurb.Bin331]|nr:MAG: hypothetical protein BWY54_00727 [Candidatus Dependentiae bacterium ADurb.Bin331]